MEMIYIGGPLHNEALSDIKRNTKGAIWYSADVFQKKLINGLIKNGEVCNIFSAPLVGAYPIGYKKVFFKAPNITESNVHCVSFFNVWGIRNFSRAKRLKKAIDEFLSKEEKKDYLIIVYCAHQPFLEAAKYLKSKTENSKICFYVPDLPQYMNLFRHSYIYDIAKKWDIKRIQKLVKSVDSFVILTEFMKNVLDIGNRPFIVAEGIVDSIPIKIEKKENIKEQDIISIVYAGGLQSTFGVGFFLDQFVKNSDTRLRLIICGAGDESERIRELADQDSRIDFRGQVTPAEVAKILESADILINPRRNDSEYTKYSFPSKNIEYLLTGKRVVACMLDGMPSVYREFIYEVKNEDYMGSIYAAIEDNEHEVKISKFLNYANENLLAEKIVNKIIKGTEEGIRNAGNKE